MAHNLHIGQKFEDFAAFESAIMRFQNAENVQFYRRDSRSVDKAQPRLVNKLDPKIVYYEVKNHCINGGKKHISKATGGREGMYVVYQTDTIWLVRFRYHSIQVHWPACVLIHYIVIYFSASLIFFNFVFSLVHNKN